MKRVRLGTAKHSYDKLAIFALAPIRGAIKPTTPEFLKSERGLLQSYSGPIIAHTK